MSVIFTDLNRLGEWAFENEMIINPAKIKAVCFTNAQVTQSLHYSLGYSNLQSEQL
jgi:hypothetical protein